ncbi:MAG: hypothetical protein P0Y59_23150 [Candidatus Sphingomonas phytovorans]|nr:hypothetical protein [Sphingomonas sp.]WEJ99767.1 MAG: hypothetical protein P0Y59_23150 [Sphingomonas sp.]
MLSAALALLLSPVPAATVPGSSRDALTQIVFTVRDKASALAQLAGVEADANAALARMPGDGDALLTRAMAIGYRAKLSKSRHDALECRAQFEMLVARNPRDPEAQAALGGWHIDAVEALGGLAARAVLGARKTTGYEATDRAVALGGDRALFTGLAALLRLSVDPADSRGAALADAATRGTTPTLLDRMMQRRAVEMVGALKGGDRRLIQALAKRLLPLGQIRE